MTPPWLRYWIASRLAMTETLQVDAARWVARHAEERSQAVQPVEDPMLLSLMTPVWNTPLPFLRELADGVLAQAERQPLEWVVLDNGSTKPELVEYLREDLARRPHVTFVRSEENLGITRGTRLCLEHASNRYVLPVDHDDRLYPDAAAVMARAICDGGYPPLLYSDEELMMDGVPSRPFFKPDWDPVLFLDQCYTAHLCALDRELALQLGAYTDTACEASPDWDSFLRFVLAGHTPVHVPEVLYCWRMHPDSTALDIGVKPYVESSHKAVLGRHLESLPAGERFAIVQSPLFSGTPDWWLRRDHVSPQPLTLVELSRRAASPAGAAAHGSYDYPVTDRLSLSPDAAPADLLSALEDAADEEGACGEVRLVAIAAAGVELVDREWAWEALGLLETHADAGVVGGRVLDQNGLILDAARHFGFGAGAGSPDAGRPLEDPGYQLWLWKRHSAGAVSSCFAVYRREFLRRFLEEGCPESVPLGALGPWAGAYATRTGLRVMYSPFLTARLRAKIARDDVPKASRPFVRANADLLPDPRYYPAVFGLDLATNYRPVSEVTRLRHVHAVLSSAERAETVSRRGSA
jgi:hypothetical protein